MLQKMLKRKEWCWVLVHPDKTHSGVNRHWVHIMRLNGASLDQTVRINILLTLLRARNRKESSLNHPCFHEHGEILTFGIQEQTKTVGIMWDKDRTKIKRKADRSKSWYQGWEKEANNRKNKLVPDRGPDLVSAAVASTSAAASAATAVAVEFSAIAGVETSAAAAPRLPPVAVTNICQNPMWSNYFPKMLPLFRMLFTKQFRRFRIFSQAIFANMRKCFLRKCLLISSLSATSCYKCHWSVSFILNKMGSIHSGAYCNWYREHWLPAIFVNL